ncbi:NAC domain superfamily [Forsythia ovata]|uniref:NAC domain superfamily n=1 Tax=Forsythia ovata TaxID=205694 RepID=A0ABD1NZ06_9LAMI
MSSSESTDEDDAQDIEDIEDLEPIPWKAIVFTPIPRKTKYSLVADRKTKTGFWKIKKGPKLVPYGLDMVAYKREFDFYEVNTLRGRFTGISMIEYRLTNRPGNNVNARFLYRHVACVVTRNSLG